MQWVRDQTEFDPNMWMDSAQAGKLSGDNRICVRMKKHGGQLSGEAKKCWNNKDKSNAICQIFP